MMMTNLLRRFKCWLGWHGEDDWKTSFVLSGFYYGIPFGAEKLCCKHNCGAVK